MLRKWITVKEEFLTLSADKKSFIFAALLCAFGISADYGVVRPACTSIFLSIFSAEWFPYAWLTTVPINFLAVYFYNHFLPKWGPRKTFLMITVFSILVNALTPVMLPIFPEYIFLQFVWKEIYILLMFKQIWSLIHTTIDTRKAKYLYGLMFGIGGLGSLMGACAPGFLAVQMGSSMLMTLSLPIYLFVAHFYNVMLKKCDIEHKENFSEVLCIKETSPNQAFSSIKNSKLLQFVLLLVVFMQISIAFVDYEFNMFLQKAIPSMDLRTQYCGRLSSLINTITLTLQFFGVFIFIQVLGLKKSHLLVPIFLMMNVFIFMLFPSFYMISYCFLAIKAVDYSFFGIIREMLYIPLKLDEKFRAKAIIDVFAYRTSRAAASCFLLLIQAIPILSGYYMISFLSLAIFIIWAAMVPLLFKNYEKQANQLSA